VGRGEVNDAYWRRRQSLKFFICSWYVTMPNLVALATMPGV